jgi:hypothetical protein
MLRTSRLLLRPHQVTDLEREFTRARYKEGTVALFERRAGF